jgi:hypothetical protein
MLLSMQVDAKPLRAELVPITAAALERIKLLLLNMARQVSRTSTHEELVMLAHTHLLNHAHVQLCGNTAAATRAGDGLCDVCWHFASVDCTLTSVVCVRVSLQATLAVLDDITARIQMLAARPTGLDEFVNYMVGCGFGRKPSACISCRLAMNTCGKCWRQ